MIDFTISRWSISRHGFSVLTMTVRRPSIVYIIPATLTFTVYPSLFNANQCWLLVIICQLVSHNIYDPSVSGLEDQTLQPEMSSEDRENIKVLRNCKRTQRSITAMNQFIQSKTRETGQLLLDYFLRDLT